MSGPLASEIESLLTAAFAPNRLAVINDSARHSGHSGDDGSGESHWRGFGNINARSIGIEIMAIGTEKEMELKTAKADS